ncbi:hypothetical protein CAEBREN_07122 [Caenorhabditis brenneri]|uniref:SPK domain-containing protein n=1 Tax=Caenorhabditis brenneri TaxID=135651 RepID=G0NN47_CAEBE|nr:hypothetical protein CAEBREN_07122 [Caenorhabditis brenneri]
MNQYDNSYYDSDNEMPDSSDQNPEAPRHKELIDLVSKMCETTEKPLNMRIIVDEYKQKHGLHPESNYLQRVLRSNAYVEVDGKKRITKYVARDGSLRLEGAHDSRSKQKQTEDPQYVTPNPKKRRDNYYEELSQSSTPKNDRDVYLDMGSQQGTQLVEPKYEEYRFMDPPTQPSQPNTSTSAVKIEVRGTVFLASQRKFLESMEALISTYFNINEVPQDSNIFRQIGEGLQKIESYQVFGVDDENKLKVEDLLIALESCFLMLRKSSSVDCNEESKSLRDFLLLFRMSVVSMSLPVLNDFQLKLKELTDELSVQDKKVPVRKIKSALETLIEMVAP